MANSREIKIVGKGKVSEGFVRFVRGEGGKTDVWEMTKQNTVMCNIQEGIIVRYYQHAITLNAPHSDEKASVGYVKDTAFPTDYAFKVRPDRDLPSSAISGPIVRREVCSEECRDRCAIVKAREAALRKTK